MAVKFIYLATADARGHLMRAQLLTHALREAGAEVRVLTTSDEGKQFLASFGIEAEILSRHYAVQFDQKQNMLRADTDRNVANYVFRPGRMLRDMGYLHKLMRDADLIVNDSFHPALLCMGALPGWRRKIVHVYGCSLRRALQTNFEGRLFAPIAKAFAALIAWEIGRARACIEHDFAFDEAKTLTDRLHQLPTPVALAQPAGANAQWEAAVYLNPHFRDCALADALQAGLADASLASHRVGEGYVNKPGWLAHDVNWIDRAARSAVIVSAPGMAALSVALVYRRPILLVKTDQPEQTENAARAVELGLPHRVVTWRGDMDVFRYQVGTAAHDLASAYPLADDPNAGLHHAHERLANWVRVLFGLATARRV